MQNCKLHHSSFLYDKSQNKPLGEDQVQMDILYKQIFFIAEPFLVRIPQA